jgi:hypothetical protein
MSAQDNLLIGPAKIFTAAAGTAVSAQDLADFLAGNTPSGWTSIGDTTAAVTLKDNPTFAQATSQQSARTLDIAVTQINTTVETTCREVTAEKLAEWIRGEVAAGVVTPSGLGPVPKFSVVMVGPWPGGQAVFHAPRCAYTGERSLAFSSEEHTSVPVVIEVLENGTEAPYTIVLD